MIFFSNPKVTGDALLQAHYHETAHRAQATKSRYILAIQDKTVLDYTSHCSKTELGRIGGSGRTSQYGLFQHNTLLVTETNEPLGLIDIQHFDYDEYDLTLERHQRPIEEKHSFSWIKASQNRRERIGALDVPVITVADREGDIFEFLYDLIDHNEQFVIRAQHNRLTGVVSSKKAPKLSTLFDKTPILGTTTILINDVKTHEIKKVTLQLKSLQAVTLPVPKDTCSSTYQPITLNLVMAYHEESCWILLTNRPVDTLEQCHEIALIYKSRWHIEDYHKILKTAYQIDEVYLHSSRQAIINVLALISLSACRLYWIIYVGRVDPECRADELFTEYEWKTPYIFLKEPIPKTPPPLAEIIIHIARMGGYKIQKASAPPGIKSMWLGLHALTIASEMYQNMMSTKT